MTRVGVVGDGPSGSAVAAALVRRQVDVVLIGADEPWTATYGTWLDDLDGVDMLAGADAPDEVLTSRADRVRIVAVTEHTIERPYAVLDGEALRQRLRAGVDHRRDLVRRVDRSASGGPVAVGDRGEVPVDLVIDATGWPSRLGGGVGSPMGWQTAWGVVLDEPPDGPLGVPTVMDWSSPGGVDEVVPTFGYALEVDDGWLVEETVLAARATVTPETLRPVLARRLGWSEAALERRGRRVERVEIPMGAPVVARPPDGAAVVAFGAAAGLAHPATGYLVAPSLRVADAVADGVVAALDEPVEQRAGLVWDALWSPAMRRTRSFHEFGLDVVLRLGPDDTRQFFETFFELAPDVWPAQMRVDTPPREIAALMSRMFAGAPWSLRRRLVSGDPRRLASVLRPR